MHPRLAVLSALALLLACPQAQSGQGGGPEPTKLVADPRVVSDTGDLYPGKAPPPIAAPAEPPTRSPGTGRTDETNGKCRLFAPELPNPECCEHNFGFDAALAQKACGHQLYLGESFQQSCGYFFLRAPATPPVWLRLTKIRGETPKQAADEHVMVMHRTAPGVAPEPYAAIPDAWLVRHEEYRWLFLPGWKAVRLLTWKDTSCSDEGIAAIARGVVAAPEEVTGPRRDGLLPGAVPPAPAAG